MAILRVNVRPADGSRRSIGSQSGEWNRLDSGIHGNEAEYLDEQTNSAKHGKDEANADWQRVVWTLLPGTPVGRAIIAATQRLEEAGSETPHLDAQVILAYVLDVERAWLFAHYDFTLNAGHAARFADLVARRVAAEPIAYIVGHKEFYGLDLKVDRRVLIPRPETELLVDAILDHVESRPDQAVRIADVGTGSGAIALAVAANSPAVKIYAIDICEDAIEVARENVKRLSSEERVTVMQGDLLSTLDDDVDIIAANLPYINCLDYEDLAPTIRRYEPQIALESGPAGLDHITRLLTQARSKLRPGGVLFLEIGDEQGGAVVDLVGDLIPDASYVGVRQDYHGLDRMVVVGV